MFADMSTGAPASSKGIGARARTSVEVDRLLLQLSAVCVQDQALQPEDLEKRDCRQRWMVHLDNMREQAELIEAEEQACGNVEEYVPLQQPVTCCTFGARMTQLPCLMTPTCTHTTLILLPHLLLRMAKA